ncbi:acetate/propionate family kinase [Acetobacter syzygii]|uniref:acetate/propionate family kinase n=1 Tax=Acetobacter syzygii TaxID=146476 RepID=UPI001570EA3E|nr:acetate/propionate family kinase [Acetobacter syzygii]NSL91769.1 acetate/propionate family kinase [Acetobacter syzygii]
MSNVVIVFNAGSSSLKFTIFKIEKKSIIIKLIKGRIEYDNETFHFLASDHNDQLITQNTFSTKNKEPLEYLFSWLSEHEQGTHHIVGVGHRIVHGGADFVDPVRVTPELLKQLESLTPFAPLHQPQTLAPVHAITKYRPQLPQIVCFDTAFHRSIPDIAQLLPLPRRYGEKGVRRYGFHGLSYDFLSQRLQLIDPELANGRTILAHLGSGASLCALKHGKSFETTMGFSTLDGLMMGSRCGMIDPGALLYMIKEESADWETLVNTLYHQSGLLGVSGISTDMRVLRERLITEADPAIRKHVQQALSLSAYRIVEEIGALAAVMEGIDGLVFTAGIGEHDAELRQTICLALGWLGLKLDTDANQKNADIISSPSSTIRVRVEPTHEELIICQNVLPFIQSAL